MAPSEIAGLDRRIDSVIKRLDDQDRKYDERREVDDTREERAQKERQLVIDRLDRHGKRATILETNWTAFFGEQGAFKGFCKQIDAHDGKIDNLRKYVFIGMGILFAAQFLVPLLLKAWGVK